MKLLSIVWACYVLVLSCLPCTHDHEAVLRPNAVASSRVDAAEPVTTSRESHPRDDDHACSPFCTCTCCGAQLSVPQTPTFRADPLDWEFLPTGQYTYPASAWVAPDATIWQPPKLG
ncbi:MAG: hypothetical protein H7Y12_16065 [Sphingobacteriaceae bacterium]|nr:hypothetical protein [Cytophagaceae bacterium]